ncbi:hypothetical protein BSR29_03625 [Boudabousia liubingyangii]|uniref:CinA C-terminal domain-containing protein n=1 Tax=Boudabousia liubingyangii TaxID=1921764 RepID=A0A1Q5PN06_9ACTO|nr:CinA family protein [Boudabousia liubingyangii]OKL47517.1 hypothetical protein BSR28_03195 [Boudabousia liubingyangii]OKL48941.1 hypothetical protein BSR29_03625 [Boudabousia liubingyangii]
MPQTSAQSTSPLSVGQRQELAQKLLKQLEDRHYTLGTAESLTGGALCSAFAEIPGASHVLIGSIVAYQPEIKSRLLGVDEYLLADHGPYNHQTVQQMARGICRVLGTKIGLATSGVAGPSDDQGTPAGTCFIALAAPEGYLQSREINAEGDRNSVRQASVDAALELLAQYLGANGH